MRTDRDAEIRAIRDAFAGRIAHDRAPRIVGVGERFEPDVVVRDEVGFGAAVAAERLGIPHASVVVLAAGGMIAPGLLDEPLNNLRAEFGLPPDPGFLDRFLTIAPVMPSFREPGTPLPASSLAIRPDVLDDHQVVDDPAIGRVDAWLASRPGQPLVYFTLGTIFHQESGDLFTRILTGLEGLTANALAVSSGDAGAAVEDVLTTPSYRLAARASQVEAESLSSAEVGADAVQQLVSCA